MSTFAAAAAATTRMHSREMKTVLDVCDAMRVQDYYRTKFIFVRTVLIRFQRSKCVVVLVVEGMQRLSLGLASFRLKVRLRIVVFHVQNTDLHQ